jgi:hypothetical protein
MDVFVERKIDLKKEREKGTYTKNKRERESNKNTKSSLPPSLPLFISLPPVLSHFLSFK